MSIEPHDPDVAFWRVQALVEQAQANEQTYVEVPLGDLIEVMDEAADVSAELDANVEKARWKENFLHLLNAMHNLADDFSRRGMNVPAMHVRYAVRRSIERKNKQ